MRRALALGALGIAGVLAAGPVPAASACDPNTFPNCQTYCRAIVYRYDQLRSQTSVDLPAVPHTGVAGCP